jgi:hypothetical protein
LCGLPRAEISAHWRTLNSCSGKHCAISLPEVLDFPYSYTAIISYICMRMYQRHANSLSLKILPINPYNSEILMPTLVELHCFHRPEGEGVPDFCQHGCLPSNLSSTVGEVMKRESELVERGERNSKVCSNNASRCTPFRMERSHPYWTEFARTRDPYCRWVSWLGCLWR